MILNVAVMAADHGLYLTGTLLKQEVKETGEKH